MHVDNNIYERGFPAEDIQTYLLILSAEPCLNGYKGMDF